MNKPVPYDRAAEESIIGTILLYPAKAAEILDAVSESDFYTPAMARIYASAKRLYQSGQIPDTITIANDLETRGEINAVGGPAALLTLQGQGSKWNTDGHIKVVKDAAIRRSLVSAGHDISDLAINGAMEVDDLLSVSEKAILDIALRDNERSRKFVHASVSTTTDGLGDLWSNGNVIKGISTGITGLDRKISGLERQKLYLIAARPAMGKSALALNIASHVATVSAAGLPVLLYSLEMSEHEINGRLTASMARIPHDRLESGRLSMADWERMAEAAHLLDSNNLLIDDDSTISVDEMYQRARRAKAEYGDLGLIVVDYIQLMNAPGDNRQLEISYISRKLKIMSKDLDVPVIGLSQLSRELERRVDKRPMLSDLRESGSLEQDANTVVFVYRDEIYDPDTLYYGMPELIVAKQRSGSTGMVRVAYVDAQTRFANLSREA